MLVGTKEFGELAWFLRGFEYASEKASPDQPPELDGFREWLMMELDGPCNVDWEGIVSWKFGSSWDATQSMIELLDRFLSERAACGLSAIIDDHERYEIRRYGAVTSSRKHRT
jgi:hypothetical protein